MNAAHLEYCAGAAWAKVVAEELMPWVFGSGAIGDHVLELGPGPGLTTDVLEPRAGRLTCVELDAALAGSLRQRLRSVEVVRADATALPFPPDTFDTVAVFTMLHHVPRIELQDLVLREAHRVLRRGGSLVGSDSIDTADRRRLHVGDVFVPLDPSGLGNRIEDAGLGDVSVEVRGERIMFLGRRGTA